MGYVADLRAIVGHRPLILAAAGALIEEAEGRLLLQRRSDDGKWDIPGGALELGETVEAAVRREVREETGLEIGGMALFGVFSGPEQRHTYPNGDEACFVCIVYRVDRVSGIMRVSHEGSELRYFAPDALPADLAPANRPIVAQWVACRARESSCNGEERFKR